jgi:hypothetical protein
MIDPSTQLAAMIRAQFAAQFRAQSQQQSAGRGGIAGQGAQRKLVDVSEKARRDPAGDSADGVDGFGEPADATQLQQLVALRVRALSPNAPQRERKAFRLFLESVLVQAFGRDRLDDKGFDQMVDAVLQRMEGDAELRAALREAGALLLSESQPAGK